MINIGALVYALRPAFWQHNCHSAYTYVLHLLLNCSERKSINTRTLAGTRRVSVIA
jgi:hypothetical protein